ncbi:MAG TPA: DUF5804 family protein [Methanocorpusculum sp.]|nr:DUF5804 family protein [Methanocorpusculum sp.]
MILVCISKPGINLYQTLSKSDTSRYILRFYHPKNLDYGISIEVSTISNALSLISEMHWYVVKYMKEVLIEDKEYNVFLTKKLAYATYDSRSVTLSKDWGCQYNICITNINDILYIPDNSIPIPADVVQTYRVWGLEEEHP